MFPGDSSTLLSRACTLVVALLVAGCGFQLQGAFDLPPDMRRTWIDTVDRHSEFYWELRRELSAAGVEIVDGVSEASSIVRIYVDDTDQRVLSVSARNVPTEYEVYYTVRYGVTSGEEVLVDVRDLTLTRDYTYDSTLVLGKEREEDVLREQIVRDLVRIVLQQISAA